MKKKKQKNKIMTYERYSYNKTENRYFKSEINKDVFYLLCLRKLIWLFPVILTLLQSIFLHIGTCQLISFANKSIGM